MIITLNGYELPKFKKITYKPDDAIALNRGLEGTLNADRSYSKNSYELDYDYLDIEHYDYIKQLFEDQFTNGSFFQLIVTGTGSPINKRVYIAPVSIRPRHAGVHLEDYTLVLIEK